MTKGAKRPLKIALSIWMFKPGTGGLQAHAEQLCRALRLKGHEVVVITRAYSRVPEALDFLFYNEPAGDVDVNGVRVRPLRLDPVWRPVQWLLSKCIHRRGLQKTGIWLYELQARRQAREAFKGFDIIHHVGQATALIGFAAERAARYYRVPFLVQPTCHPFQAGDDPLDHRLFQCADRLLVHTRFEAAHFEDGNYRMPVDVVGNGIEDRSDGEAERFRQQTGITGPIVLYIGRKDSDKGYPLVVEAFRKLCLVMPDANLVCIGPPGGEKAKAQARFHDMEFVSEQTKHDALAACTCLCVPSIGESFGLVYMEAGRYSKPVVARRLPVLEELLENGRAGLLVGKADVKNNHVPLTAVELAMALHQLLDAPEKCQELGRNCKRVSDQFIWSEVVKRFEDAYQVALANHEER
jgi:glycosyltransferase involved in cell wall biosynthesis